MFGTGIARSNWRFIIFSILACGLLLHIAGTAVLTFSLVGQNVDLDDNHPQPGLEEAHDHEDDGTLPVRGFGESNQWLILVDRESQLPVAGFSQTPLIPPPRFI